jgi:hypothetical protein
MRNAWAFPFSHPQALLCPIGILARLPMQKPCWFCPRAPTNQGPISANCDFTIAVIVTKFHLVPLWTTESVNEGHHHENSYQSFHPCRPGGYYIDFNGGACS